MRVLGLETRIFYNGRVYTLNPSDPMAEAIVVESGEIVYVGDNHTALSKYSGEKIDLKGYTVLPGIFDAHLHLEGVAMLEAYVDLSNCKSIEELKTRLKTATSKVESREWIIGRGWDQELFVEKRMPNKRDLDEISRENPILIVRVCGHVGVLNSVALEELGISKSTRDPPGGVIGRDENGEPNGILWEEALTLAREKIPPPRIERLVKYLRKKIYELNSQGITGVATMSTKPQLLRALVKLWSRGELKIRVRVFLEETLLKNYSSTGLLGGFGDDTLKISGVKTFMDGSLGGRSAALKEEYSDDPGNKGLLLRSREDVRILLEECVENNMILAIHAIGDRAIEEACLGVLEAKAREYSRIEHASLTPPSTLNLLEKTEPTAVVVQPHFKVSDWWVKDRLGERAKWTYVFKEMLKRRIKIAGSSDAPVEPFNPWLGIWAATCIGSDRLSVEEAIEIYTIGGWRSVREPRGGVLRERAYPDFSVYRVDPLKLGCKELKNVKPWMTVVNGDIVYSSKSG